MIEAFVRCELAVTTIAYFCSLIPYFRRSFSLLVIYSEEMTRSLKAESDSFSLSFCWNPTNISTHFVLYNRGERERELS
jgi:hypothetical protein